ncbi:MAG TPA: Gfo/Idh/MocA family oxidoreductase [Microbacterium sp.]|nr:Gfo/Idh/MocA family oxidoreductase [Microbacterium sp.]
MGNAPRIGIVGVGVISGAYLSTLTARPDVRVTAIADLNMDRAAEVTAGIPGARALAVPDLLADPEVDVVLNLTIPAAHADIALAAIANGKHVYGEKPLAVDFKGGRLVADAAAAAGVRLGCAPDTVLGTGTQTARAVIDEGRIGRPLAATAVWGSAGHESWHPNPDFYYLPGGGPLMDMGPYYVSTLIHLLGPVTSVIASASRLRDERVIGSGPRAGESIPVEVDTHVSGVLEHASGALSTITTSFDSVRSGAAPIEVHGETGSLSVPDPNLFSGDVSLFARGSKEWEPVEERAGYVDAGRGVGLLDMLAAPSDADVRASGRFALHTLEVMSALIEAAHSDVRVRLSTTVQRPSVVPLGYDFDLREL